MITLKNAKVYLFFVLVVSCLSTSAQSQINPLAHQLNPAAAPSFKPYVSDSSNWYPDIKKESSSKLLRALFLGNFIQYKDKEGIDFNIHPFVNLELGRQNGSAMYADSNYFTNSRGFVIEGNVGKKLSFFSSFQESQSKYLPYIANHVDSSGASIGNGRVKPFKGNGYDYAIATGQLVYRPVENLQLWFGNGKNFIGNGYRSLFLSDNSTNYPYTRISYQFRKKLEYQVLFASLSTGNRFTRYSSVEPQYITKGYSAVFVTWKVSEKFEASLFESTVWNRSDAGKHRGINALQFNPIIGVSALTQGLDGANNCNLGLNLLLKPGHDFTFYGQALLDGAHGTGLQLGATKSNIFGQDLFVRGEFNLVSGKTYSAKDSTSNYTNFMQPLAHPMGAGFTEMVGTVRYRLKRLIANVQGSYATFPDGYYGPGLIHPGGYNTGSSSAKLLFVNPTIGFIINPTSNLQLNIGTIYRVLQTNLNTDKTSYLFVRLSTNITNLYFDF